jgi:Arv1-like family
MIRAANSPYRESTIQQCGGLNVRERSMPICISCSTPVNNLYTTYSKADDRSLGKGVRLTQCPRCKRFADKYVEHDFVVLFIDLVLIKPQVRDLPVLMGFNICAESIRLTELQPGLQTSPVQPPRPLR